MRSVTPARVPRGHATIPSLYKRHINTGRGLCMALQYDCTLFSLIYQLPRLSPSWVSGGAMVLGNFPVPGRPTIRMIVGQEPIALAVGAGGGCLDIFTLLYPLSPLSPSL